MSTDEWMPDMPKPPEPGQSSSSPMPYLLVPPLHIDRSGGLNSAGWSDPTPEAVFVCKACKKELRATFLGLAVFPSFKANLDLFQFTYRIPEHKSGGAFSKETCKESGTKVTRVTERPTSMRFLSREGQTGADAEAKETVQAAESVAEQPKDDPLAILKARLARGEINEKEFARLAKVVEAGMESSPEEAQEEADRERSDEELRKKLDSLSPQMAEERYKYLSSKPITELTDAEYDERLALAQRLPGKRSDASKKK